jgi:phage-related protein
MEGSALYEILFYNDRSGKEPVYDYMRELAVKGSKDSRIKFNKISQYVKMLEEKGTLAGEPYLKHLDGDIWELRPIRDRILFAAIVGGRFVLLHCFMKQTGKTPSREIEQAKRELADFLERGGANGY